MSELATKNQLEQLKQHTVVVADTGDFQTLKEYEPRDATTNPTLLLKATQMEEYAPLVEQSLSVGREAGGSRQARVDRVVDDLLVRFGMEILAIIPGRVSTEADARLSFDTEGTVAKAREIVSLYETQGADRERVLVKIASTWEGIAAAEILEKEGIHCNMTLLFSLVQAARCAEAKATLLSPFVGRILDWHKAKTGEEYAGPDDPGVKSVRAIYDYFKKFGFQTEIMGASFRNKSEILELAGCDLLTISPALLGELQKADEPIERKLDPEAARQKPIERLELDEKRFRWLLNEDAMATEKTAEGIRNFAADIRKLEAMVEAKLD